jgi:dTDP-4-dehydrorhamnose reductase
MVKTAVLGAAGQLGRDLCARLSGVVVPLTRAEVDLTRPESFSRLRQLQPDIVINCAAYNHVDQAEVEPAAAFHVNAWGVRELARLSAEQSWLLVHFSTDYVFGLDCQRSTPYRSSDAPGPVNVYGSSKLAGEYFVRALCPRHVILRTCGLYGVWGSGGKGGNFVETMLRLASQGKPLRVVADQICTPSYTVDVAAATAELLATGQFGLHHATNGGCCSWFEFAQEIFRQAGLTADLTAITSAEYGAPARRPSYSVLQPSKELSLRPWQEALQAYLQERRQRG